MKVKLDNSRIYIVTREYSGFHNKVIDVETIISVEAAIKLRSELDAAINSIQQPVQSNTIKPCSNCGSTKEACEKHCAECWKIK